MSNIASQIAHLEPCSEARRWLATQNSWEEAWNNCNRANWLFWLIGKDKSITRNQIVVCACAIARTSLQFVKAGEDRPRIAIETAERWTNGEATIEEVRIARNAAYAAAAYAAAYAAAAADAAAAYAAAYADAYADAAAAAAADAAAAYAAAYAALADGAADAAAYAAAYAAADAYAALAADAAAYAAAYADAYADAAAAKVNAQKENCRIIRSYFPNVPNVFR